MQWMRFLPFLILSLLPFSCLAQTAPAAKPFQKIDGCVWKADRWNDGDSFHAVTGDENREIVVRLYFVDTPEAETAYRDRIDEQAAYFGITRAQAVDLAHEAAAFTEKRLSQPFTVWTRWRSALGRSALGRVYCIIITSSGEDLNEVLVANGLARIYGTKTVLYDGRDSKTYVAHLQELEAKAKMAKLGGWGINP
jgi:endonuclease YncB( thermonuclease family)